LAGQGNAKIKLPADAFAESGPGMAAVRILSRDASCHPPLLSIRRNEKLQGMAIAIDHFGQETKGKGYAYGSSGKHRVGFDRQMVAFA
jgi:hypothetical protein